MKFHKNIEIIKVQNFLITLSPSVLRSTWPADTGIHNKSCGAGVLFSGSQLTLLGANKQPWASWLASRVYYSSDEEPVSDINTTARQATLSYPRERAFYSDSTTSVLQSIFFFQKNHGNISSGLL